MRRKAKETPKVPWVVVLALDDASLYLTKSRSFMLLRKGNPILYIDTQQHAEQLIRMFRDDKPGFTGHLFATKAIWAEGEYGIQEWQAPSWGRRRWGSRRSTW